MGLTVEKIALGTELPPLVKRMTLENMKLFSGGEGRAQKVNLHTDATAAQRDTGLKQPFASGRMSLGYACEMMSRFLGLETFNRTGKIDFKFVKPVMPGDTITVRGRISELEELPEGIRVTVDIYCENQKGEKTSVGNGSAIVPKT
jgi:3-hydroxybutyryl-CoA dehydratase